MKGINGKGGQPKRCAVLLFSIFKKVIIELLKKIKYHEYQFF